MISNSETQNYVQRTLLGSGFQTETLEDGTHILHMFDSFPSKFDILICDQYLPGIEGIEICRSMRQIRLNVPIVLLIDDSDEMEGIPTLEMGANAYLMKTCRRTHFKTQKVNRI